MIFYEKEIPIQCPVFYREGEESWGWYIILGFFAPGVPQEQLLLREAGAMLGAHYR